MQTVVKTIRLPKKEIVAVNNKLNHSQMLCQYEIQPAHNCNDPNIAGSPPNSFVNLLKQRMENYYRKTG
jgi:hypothetical protein